MAKGQPEKPPAGKDHAAHTATVKQLAGQAGLAVDLALLQLQEQGFAVKHKDNKLAGAELRRAREALGLRAWGERKEPPVELLSEDDLVIRMLRPMLTKGKNGPEHHTEFTNVWGKGIPVHQQGQARELAEAMRAGGELGSKVSVGALHVWLTNTGRARLQAALVATGQAD